ncbi:threonine transporter RhtB [Acinetobacter sp. ANC 4633]|uniref:LysE family transporter n=1 Tax=Acinetobacter sp. ANC 4633 TaxID=2529845 RepID=UPI001039006E|nr:LysE family transporter [Acinetobacter sp. ANC 4633]TCB28616.1 threonine transporter RhtB [Acinetobacter sp. ANC 4633]
MSFHLWLSFFAACWVISLFPGAGAIASMSNGLSHGFLRGLWNILGLQLALLLQILIVATGLGMLLNTFPVIFLAVKWLGVLYLIYLAYIQWKAPVNRIAIHKDQQQFSGSMAIFKGFLINISNPKAIVFFLAIFPQFIDPKAPQFKQYMIMALTMIPIDVIVMLGYTGLASKASSVFQSYKKLKIVNRFFASMYGVAAMLLSLVRQKI